MGEFTKLSNLVGDDFTITEVRTFIFKKWDVENKKMLMSHSWEDGYKKVYPITTNKGQMDLGQGQLGSLLETVSNEGKADIVSKTFHVKSNGETGINIRYYFNEVKQSDIQAEEELDERTAEDLNELGF